EPAHDRNVVVRADWRVAFRAVRGWQDDGLRLGDPQNANVEEAADEQPGDEYDERNRHHNSTVPQAREALNRGALWRVRWLTALGGDGRSATTGPPHLRSFRLLPGSTFCTFLAAISVCRSGRRLHAASRRWRGVRRFGHVRLRRQSES